MSVMMPGEETPPISPPDSEMNAFQDLAAEEQEKKREEWQKELDKVNEEIDTLRQILNSRLKDQQELRRKLGLSVWKEFQDDMSQGIRNVKDSNVYANVEGTIGQIGKTVTDTPIYQNVEEKIEQIGKAVVEAPLYQKTESVIKSTAEKTTSIIGGFGSGITSKLGQLKNSESFRSFEEKVGSAYENVKTRVVPLRSTSMHSIDSTGKDAESGRSKSTANTPATTPVIPE